jgi:DNA-binding winged helix-turn-helix (wHTH) protein
MHDVFAMNEARAARGGSGIVLAQEKPVRLARTRVRPASLELELEGETIRVEPRVMQVLVALSRAGGEPASRQQLIERCWGGRLVTDGALNRSIAQLRKSLRDPTIEISTIPRVGYRLRPAPTEESLQPTPVPVPPASTATESAADLPPVAGAAPGSVPARGAIAEGADGSGFSRRSRHIAAVVLIALLLVAVVVWEWSV